MHNPGMSSTESRALEISGPQPVWMTLNEARQRAFTGEIVFELDPEVYAYLDNGVVYYAERAGEAALGQRLLAAGVVDETQLERGVVRVGDVEHLGRLFDRDPSVDRDAVLVLAELLTQDLITDLANREIAAVRITAYRHHPSGVHRWFVEPADAAGAVLADMAQIGHTGRLSAIPVASDEALSDELRIEWDEPLGVFDDGSRSVFADFDVARLEAVVDTELVDSAELRSLFQGDEPAETEAGSQGGDSVFVGSADVDVQRLDDLDVEFLPDGPDVDEPTDMVPAGDMTDTTTDSVADADTEFVADTDMAAETEFAADTDSVVDAETDEVPPPDGEFQVVWPDGSATDVSETAVEEMETAGVDETLALVHEDDGGFRFEMPPLTSGTSFDDTFGDEADDGDVPDDVADAVRRALAAIETATAESASIAPMDDPIAVEYDDVGAGDEPVDDSGRDSSDHDSDDGGDDAVRWDRTDDVDDLWGDQPATDSWADVPAAKPSGASLSAFAPPTPDMAAEAIYSREAAEAMSAMEASGGVASTDVAEGIDDGHGGDDGERTSALKRLIGSLRRKDR